jgi:glycosyltransferase involved in cell wall biosynthesis
MPASPANKVTVIVTSFNQEEFIGAAIESVAGQDHENLEILACDDASTDGTLAVLDEWAARDPRVRVIRAERNTGVAENRNRGLQARSGDFVALLDGDDVMRPGKLSAQVAALEARADAAGCLHDAEVFDSDTGTRLGLFTSHVGSGRLREGGSELWLDPTYIVLPSTMMFRSSAVASLRLDRRLPFTNEWLFCIELFRRGPCLALDGVYLDYRKHAAQMTTDSATRGFEEGMMIMALVDARCPELARHTRTMRAALLYGEARRRMGAGERGLALRYARTAARSGGVSGHVRLVSQVAGSRRRKAAVGSDG